MEESFERAVAAAVLAIEAAAALILVCATALAFVQLVRLVIRGRMGDAEQRAVWLRLARWLVISLEFQLAADLLHTAVAPSWAEIGRVAAVAAIRTFLNYALEADLEKLNRRREAGAKSIQEPGEAPAVA